MMTDRLTHSLRSIRFDSHIRSFVETSRILSLYNSEATSARFPWTRLTHYFVSFLLGFQGEGGSKDSQNNQGSQNQNQNETKKPNKIEIWILNHHQSKSKSSYIIIQNGRLLFSLDRFHSSMDSRSKLINCFVLLLI
jgi:hypothetical protein